MSNANECNAPDRSRSAGRIFVVALAVLVAAGLSPNPVRAQAKKADELTDGFYLDFRVKHELPPGFAYFGPDPMDVTRFEKEGLRITFPPKRRIADRVGVESRERIRGDFEITTTYQILKADQPIMGHGVGVELFIATDSPTKEELAVFRVARVREGQVYLTSRATMDEAGKRGYRTRSFPAEVKSGRLRITRVGGEATLWAADGDADEFIELNRVDLGPEV